MSETKRKWQVWVTWSEVIEADDQFEAEQIAREQVEQHLRVHEIEESEGATHV